MPLTPEERKQHRYAMTRAWKRHNATSYGERERIKAKKRYHLRARLLRELKEIEPCVDCQQHFPHYVMHFDHTRGTKKGKVCEFAGRGWDSLLEELDKCDIVCANCHMIRTHNRRAR